MVMIKNKTAPVSPPVAEPDSQESPPPEEQIATTPTPAEEEVDEVELASMDSFPCSDPPGYYPIRS